MMPTPTPAPPIQMQAMPAPIYFAAPGPMENSFSRLESGPSVARVNRIVEIDASENGENVGLQESHQKLKRRQKHDHNERQRCTEPAKHSEAGEHDDKTGEDLK